MLPLAGVDAQVRLEIVAPRASAVCKDPDDQKFIDLAVAHKSTLLSKDNAVLFMAKRLSALEQILSTTDWTSSLRWV